MNISFIPVGQEADELVEFLTAERWPYHGTENPAASIIREAFANGAYHHEHTRTFWIVESEGGTKVGLIRLFDVADPNVSFDLRILTGFRGRGIGRLALEWIASYVFTEFPDVIRVEGHTRVDNAPMRALFEKCNRFVLEAYHRKSWRQSGQLYDTVTYAVIREDWENGRITPIPWKVR